MPKLKTHIGTVSFSGPVPKIDDVVSEAKRHLDHLSLEYVDSNEGDYYVRFLESPDWCAHLCIEEHGIEITDDLGMVEGPAVAQTLLYVLRQLGGRGPENDPRLVFPLTQSSLRAYEEAYLATRPKVPRAVKPVLFGAGAVLLLVIAFSAYLLLI